MSGSTTAIIQATIIQPTITQPTIVQPTIGPLPLGRAAAFGKLSPNEEAATSPKS